MKRYAILAIAFAFSFVAIAFASSVCDNAPCETPINAAVGKEFTISVDSNPMSTGFEWWTKFDADYISLVNSSFTPGNASPRMVGVPGMEVFTFRAEKAGQTEVYLLLLRPWVNGTIVEKKIFPVIIIE